MKNLIIFLIMIEHVNRKWKTQFFGFFTMITLMFPMAPLMSQPIHIDSISPIPSAIPCHTPIDLDLYLSGEFIDPDDPNQIQLNLIMTTPSGKKLSHPGFYLNGPNDASHWQIRFTPLDTGEYRLCLEAKTPENIHLTESIPFRVNRSEQDGFIRSHYHHFCFRFDSGKTFKGIGINLDRMEDTEDTFRRLNAMGCNFARIQFNLDYPSHNRLNNDSVSERYGNASMDSILALAERYHIYIEVCLDDSFMTPDNDRSRNDRPSSHSFTKPSLSCPDSVNSIQPVIDYHRYFRSILARYGYHPHILAWELKANTHRLSELSEKMGNYLQEAIGDLKRMDIHHHLISITTLAKDSSKILTIPELDFLQFESDDSGSMVLDQETEIYSDSRVYGKAHIISGIAGDYRHSDSTGPNSDDPRCIQMLWLGVFTPSPIIPIIVHSDRFNRSPELQGALKSISQYCRKMFSQESPFVRINLKEIVLPDVPSSDLNGDDELTLFPSGGWNGIDSSSFSLRSEIAFSDWNRIPNYLIGRCGEKSGQPVEFNLDYHQKGEFSIYIKPMRDTSRIVISLDNEPVLNRKLEAPVDTFHEVSSDDQRIGHTRLMIPVSKGSHTIRIDNQGSGWVEIGAYRFTRSGINNPIPLIIRNLKRGHEMFIWVQHPDYARLIHSFGLESSPIDHRVLTTGSLPNGRYRLEWWNPATGTLISRQEIFNHHQPELFIPVPSVSRELVGKLTRIGELEF